MEYVVPCDLKLNLTLRITGHRDDGFHDLCSLFLALKGPETLTIMPCSRDNVRDSIFVHNAEIEGENLLLTTARLLRESGVDLSPLEIHIWKQIPPGSGLGGGSGNAASFIRWVEGYTGTGIPGEILLKLGADVPFLCRTRRLSLVTGIGEIQEDLSGELKKKVMVVFPEWDSPTRKAYRDLDEYYRLRGWPMRASDARDEAADILQRVRQGEKVGLLPNDFAPVLMERFPGYDMFFREAETSEALCYGLTGSGSACFALFDDFKGMKDLYMACTNWAWVKKILVLE